MDLDLEEVIKASMQKGVRFNLSNGTYISIQQNSNVYCHLRIDEKDLLDCEVGIFYNDAEDTSVVIGWVSPEELVTLLECAIQGKEIPKELLDAQM